MKSGKKRRDTSRGLFLYLNLLWVFVVMRVQGGGGGVVEGW